MRPIAIKTAFFCCLLVLAGTASAQTDSERVAGFKRASAALKAIHRVHLPQSDWAELAAAAREIQSWGQQIPAQFPPGSDAPDDRARPAIWQDFDRFSGLADAMAGRAAALAEQAQSRNKAAITLALEALGDSCSACHRRFRAKR